MGIYPISQDYYFLSLYRMYFMSFLIVSSVISSTLTTATTVTTHDAMRVIKAKSTLGNITRLLRTMLIISIPMHIVQGTAAHNMFSKTFARFNFLIMLMTVNLYTVRF